MVADGTYEFQGIKASPISSGYRNKMEFSFGDEVKDGPLALGMHKRGSFYDIVTTPECRIVHPDFCRILVATKEYFEELGLHSIKITASGVSSPSAGPEGGKDRGNSGRPGDQHTEGLSG